MYVSTTSPSIGMVSIDGGSPATASVVVTVEAVVSGAAVVSATADVDESIGANVAVVVVSDAEVPEHAAASSETKTVEIKSRFMG